MATDQEQQQASLDGQIKQRQEELAQLKAEIKERKVLLETLGGKSINAQQVTQQLKKMELELETKDQQVSTMSERLATIDITINDLKSKNQELEKQNQSLLEKNQDDLIDINLREGQLKAENQQLQKETEEQNNKIKQLQEAESDKGSDDLNIKTLKLQIEQLKKQLEEQSQQIGAQQEEIDKVESVNQQLRNEVANQEKEKALILDEKLQLQDQFHTLKQKIEIEAKSYQKLIVEKESALSNLEQSLKEEKDSQKSFIQDLDQENRINKNLEETLNVKILQLKDITKRNSDLQIEFDTMEKEKRNLKMNLQRESEERVKLQTQVITAKNVENSHKEQIKNLEVEAEVGKKLALDNSRLTEDIQLLKMKIESNQSDYGLQINQMHQDFDLQLRNEKMVFANEIEKLKRQNEQQQLQAEAQIKDKSAQNDDKIQLIMQQHRNETEQIFDQIKQVQAAKGQLELRIIEQQGSIAELHKMSERQESNIQSQQQNIAELRNRNDLVEKRCQEFSKQLEQQKSNNFKLTQQSLQKDNKIKQLFNKIKSIVEQHQESQSELNKLNHVRVKLNSDIERLKQTLAARQRALKEYETQIIPEFKKKIQQKDTEIQLLQEMINSLKTMQKAKQVDIERLNKRVQLYERDFSSVPGGSLEMISEAPSNLMRNSQFSQMSNHPIKKKQISYPKVNSPNNPYPTSSGISKSYPINNINNNPNNIYKGPYSRYAKYEPPIPMEQNQDFMTLEQEQINQDIERLRHTKGIGRDGYVNFNLENSNDQIQGELGVYPRPNSQFRKQNYQSNSQNYLAQLDDSRHQHNANLGSISSSYTSDSVRNIKKQNSNSVFDLNTPQQEFPNSSDRRLNLSPTRVKNSQNGAQKVEPEQERKQNPQTIEVDNSEKQNTTEEINEQESLYDQNSQKSQTDFDEQNQSKSESIQNIQEEDENEQQDQDHEEKEEKEQIQS